MIDEFVPSKLVRPGQRLSFPWVRYRSVKRAKQHYHNAKTSARVSGLNADKYVAEDLKRGVDSAVLSAKAHYENKLTEQIKTEPKRFFNYTRHFTKSSSTIDVLEDNGSKVTEDSAKANLLNSFFISVNTDETPLDSSHKFTSTTTPEFILRDIVITPDDVRKKLSKLKPNKASGPDGISVNVLRNCLNFDVPLKILFDKSLKSGVVPQDWRDANVTPLFKKGARTKSSNYRPVSLTSQIVKLLERIVYDNILSTLTKNKCISCHQHGFQEKCSCVSQLLECLQDWTLNLDDSIQTDIIYLDFAKAFDTVPHERLPIKLKNSGIRGNALNWVRSFLGNRRQRVVIEKRCLFVAKC